MSGADQPAGGVAQLWSRPQHAVAYQEARAVLQAQLQRKSNLDDKALRTTRLTTVIVGALITAVKAFDFAVAGPVGYFGIGLLLASFGTGLASYSVEGPTLGPGVGGLSQLLEMDEEWEREFLSEMETAITKNIGRLERSSLLLLVSDGTLFAGVIATLSAIAL